jgi:hypothetical protein
MQPWKMFVRSVSVVTVLTAGGFAAGQAVMPFTNASRGTAPSVEEEAPDTEAPAVDPAAEVDDTTTTTEAPASETPSVDPVADPVPTTPPAVEAPVESTTTTTTATPIDVTAAPPAAPVADPAPAKAPKVKKAKKAKGDHNCDGHLDNGWMKHVPPGKTYPDCNATSAPAPAPAPVSAPAPAPTAAPQDKGRPETAPAHPAHPAHPEQAKNDEAPGHAESSGPSATAPGQMKKSV